MSMMMPYLTLIQQSCAARRPRLSTTSSSLQSRIVMQGQNHQCRSRRSFFAVSTRAAAPFRVRHNSSSSASQQPTKHAASGADETAAAQAQKSAYAYYQRQQQGGVWNKVRQYVWPRNKIKPRVVTATSTSAKTATTNARNVNTAWYMAAVVIGALGATYASVPLYKVFCQTTGFGGTTQRVRSTVGGGETATGADSSVGSTIVSLVDGLLASVSEQFQRLSSGSSSSSSSLSSTTKSRFGGGARVHTWTDEEAAARLASLKPVANADLLTIRFDTTVGDVLPWSFVPVQLDVKVVPGETALSFFRVTNHSPDKAITGVATYNVHPAKVGLYFQKIQCFCFEEQRLLPGETVDMPVFFFIDPEIVNDPQVSYVRSITLSYTFFQTDEDDLDNDDENDDDENDEDDKKTALSK
jgi:cytochrome c oxidase assembly protein subunit 11